MNRVTDAERRRLKALIWPIITLDRDCVATPPSEFAARRALRSLGVSARRAEGYIAEVIGKKRYRLVRGLEVESNPYEVAK